MARIPVHRLGFWNLGQFPGTRSILYLKMVILKLLPKQFNFLSVVSKGDQSWAVLFLFSIFEMHTFQSSLSLCDLLRTLYCLPLCLPALPWECSGICILLWYAPCGGGPGARQDHFQKRLWQVCVSGIWKKTQSPGKKDFGRLVLCLYTFKSPGGD